MPPLPLEGIRVLDLTVVWSGPFTVYTLGDLGAEVIKVESIQRWDILVRDRYIDVEKIRAHSPDVHPDAGLWDVGRNWGAMRRNHRSVTMDLTRPEGREAFLKLVEKCDVFVENNAVNVTSSLGISYDVLKEINPRLIMLSMPAFGSTGPYKDYRGYGANMEALMGHGLLRGYPDLDPTYNGSVLFSDAASGALGSFAVMNALFQRHRTGKGQLINMAQAEAVAQAYAQAYMDYSMNGRQQTTLGNRDVSRAPQGVYPSLGDDAWITISCGDDIEFAALCGVMGQPELATDKRFANSLNRYNNQDELDPYIAAWTATKSNIDAFHQLQAAGVTAGPVLIQPDIFDDPQLKARDVWQEVTLKMTGTHTYLKPIIGRMSKTPLSIRRPAPTLGQDNEYVYKELLGYSEQEYQWFVDNDHAGEQFLFQRQPNT
jgi:crotonobetainyl-CoA:carnitine CoA-transferase CaiB-like acyl-CoA transferase